MKSHRPHPASRRRRKSHPLQPRQTIPRQHHLVPVNPICLRCITRSIANTADDALYQSEQWDPISGEDLAYEIPNIPNGDYQVVLHFAEVYAESAGVRVFSVAVEGTTVIQDLDIYGTTGNDAALAVTIYTNVTDEAMTIDFLRNIENPKVNAIEMRSAATVPPDSDMPSTAPWSVPSMLPSLSLAPSMSEVPSMVPSSSAIPTSKPSFSPSASPVVFEPIYINVGGGQIVYPSTNNVWEANNFYNTGDTSSTSASISGTLFDELYQTERYDVLAYPNLEYSIPLPDGWFVVKLHFADIWSTRAL